MTPQQRSLRGRMGAYAQLAKYDPRVTTAKARQVFRESFAIAIREAHPELPEDEVQRRGDAARRAWYAGISVKSAKERAKRARRKAAKNMPAAPEPLPSSAEVVSPRRKGSGSEQPNDLSEDGARP